MYVNQKIRRKRLLKREKQRYGSRIEYGNDLYQNHIAFMDWAMQYEQGDLNMRSRLRHMIWIQDLKCKVI
jgi:hypothetical protein